MARDIYEPSYVILGLNTFAVSVASDQSTHTIWYGLKLHYLLVKVAIFFSPVDSKALNQTVGMHRLTCSYTGQICPKTENRTTRLICSAMSCLLIQYFFQTSLEKMLVSEPLDDDNIVRK